jgi:hypothetical protein
MDIKVENVTDFKEEEDSLSVTCPELRIEKEVSCVCMRVRATHTNFQDSRFALTDCCLIVIGV